MTMDLTEKFAKLKEKQDSLNRNKLELEVKLDSLSKDIEEGLKELKTKYNVNSLKEAVEVCTENEKTLQERLTKLDSELSAYEESLKGDDE